MKKFYIILTILTVAVSSCVSKQKFSELKDRYHEANNELLKCKAKEVEALETRAESERDLPKKAQ